MISVLGTFQEFSGAKMNLRTFALLEAAVRSSAEAPKSSPSALDAETTFEMPIAAPRRESCGAVMRRWNFFTVRRHVKRRGGPASWAACENRVRRAGET